MAHTIRRNADTHETDHRAAKRAAASKRVARQSQRDAELSRALLALAGEHAHREG